MRFRRISVIIGAWLAFLAAPQQAQVLGALAEAQTRHKRGERADAGNSENEACSGHHRKVPVLVV